MTKLTISEAAKLTPHNRQTLYKHAKEGKLTTTKDALGKTTVDVSELQRVYGTLNTGETPETPEADDMRQSETPEPTALVPTVDDKTELVETLQSQVKFLSTQLEVANREKQQLLNLAESQVLALPKPVEPEPEKKSFWSRLWKRSSDTDNRKSVTSRFATLI